MSVYKIFNPLRGQWKKIPSYLKKLYGILEILIREVSHGVVVVVIIVVVVVVVVVVVMPLVIVLIVATLRLKRVFVISTSLVWSPSAVLGACQGFSDAGEQGISNNDGST